MVIVRMKRSTQQWFHIGVSAEIFEVAVLLLLQSGACHAMCSMRFADGLSKAISYIKQAGSHLKQQLKQHQSVEYDTSDQVEPRERSGLALMW